MIVAMSVTISWYTMYWLPEENQKVFVDEHILNPDGETVVNIIMGSATPEQKDNYMPKTIQVQLTIDNKVRWVNQDEIPHTVTPDSYDHVIVEKIQKDIPFTFIGKNNDVNFNNEYVKGAFDMTNRYMAGDWRQYYLDVQDSTINNASIELSLEHTF